MQSLYGENAIVYGKIRIASNQLQSRCNLKNPVKPVNGKISGAETFQDFEKISGSLGPTKKTRKIP
jgi:hypothetical protein